MLELTKDELGILVQMCNQVNVPGQHCRIFGKIQDKLEAEFHHMQAEEIGGNGKPANVKVEQKDVLRR